MLPQNANNAMLPSPPMARMLALEQLASGFAANERPERKKTHLAMRRTTRILAVLLRTGTSTRLIP
ncbi:MAG TPA: hypothetical protein VFS66_07045 [Acidimicrobiia bacterium]|nr:hypothetical protein [Acidimicrobiia bacterium]